MKKILLFLHKAQIYIYKVHKYRISVVLKYHIIKKKYLKDFWEGDNNGKMLRNSDLHA